MTERPLAFRTAGELTALMRAGTLAPAELLDCYLDRIRRHDATARAYITVTEEIARDAARHARARLDKDGDAPALTGLPYAVKDVIDASGVLTTGGSRVLSDNRARENARVVDLMTAGGAVLLGKTNLHEFAFGATGENPLTGTATNPYDPTRLAGGSSSGSAAAVGYGLAAAALGTDTGGSVRVPASLCGLVGLKPTLGRISSRGVIPFAWSLDHLGTLTRSVGDAALLLRPWPVPTRTTPAAPTRPSTITRRRSTSRSTGSASAFPSASISSGPTARSWRPAKRCCGRWKPAARASSRSRCRRWTTPARSP